MSKQKAEAKHWMLGFDKEKIAKAKNKLKKLILTSYAGLGLSVGSFSLLSIPNLPKLLMLGFIFSGICFGGVFTNCTRKASIIKKELKNDKMMRKVILAPSIEKLSKKELELHEHLYPKSQIVRVEPRNEKVKVDYHISETIIEA